MEIEAASRKKIVMEIVQKLWNYCNVLRDDGMSYGDYVEQLTYLLFLKMADERSKPPYNQKSPIPTSFKTMQNSAIFLMSSPARSQKTLNQHWSN